MSGSRSFDTDANDPKCDKCGAPIDSGIMAVGCPHGQGCEFWTPELDSFMAMFTQAVPHD